MKILQIALLLLSFVRAEALTLEELQRSFQIKRLKIEDAGKTKIATLSHKYLVALEKTQKKYQDSGRLDDTLAIQAEIDLVKSEKWPLPPLAGKAPLDLVSLRKIYFKSYLSVQRETGTELMSSVDTMDQLLEKQVSALTKAGDLNGAQAARRYRKELGDDEGIKGYRALLARVWADGSSSVGMRIRRAGDHLEVLVRYDSSGEISPESKISNVVEITGGKIEKGDTEAKTLGEFIGSKGFKVDPFVALEKTFNDRTLAPVNVTALETQFLKKDEDETGVRLVSIAKPVNTHISLGHCLPGLSEKGTYEVKVRYFIPKTNDVIKGIKFVQGVGQSIPGSESKTVGKWETLSFTATSTHDRKNLLLYLYFDPKAAGVQKKGDYLNLSSLSVKHIAFSAYIVERFDKDGAIVESFRVPAEQKQIARNGAILPQN